MPTSETSVAAPFGLLLRRHREDRRWTQEELGRRANLSARGISDLERGLKLPRDGTVRLLAEALDLAQPERSAFEAAVRRPPSTRTRRQATPGDAVELPAPSTSFVGRKAELRAVLGFLRRRDVRLVTLTGPGGIGKSRLALQVAAALGRDFPEGVFYVRLAGRVRQGAEPSDIVQEVAVAIAEALSVRSAGELSTVIQLRERLRADRVLLVLDNFEPVLAAKSLVADLLETCPRLTVLVTSRVSLHLRGEWDYPLEPLVLPSQQGGVWPGAEVPECEAVALFVDRAKAVRSTFSLTKENASLVAAVCFATDGLPLAIELAAAQLKRLSLPDLVELLGDRLRLLSGGPVDLPERQRTILATIAWSYDHLETDEQRALVRRLAVFAGGCTAEAAAAVATGGDRFAALDGLGALTDQSLLRRTEESGGKLRFRMLETIREFALRRLVEHAEADAARERHLAYFVGLAEQAEAELGGPNQADWLDRLMAEFDNLRAAFAWAEAQRDATAALRLSASLWRFWTGRGLRRDGRAWLERALAIDGEVGPELRAQALYRLGAFAIDRDDYDEARTRLEDALGIHRRLGNLAEVADSLAALGVVASEQGDLARARDLFDEAYLIRRDSVPDDRRGIALSLFSLAQVARDEKAYERAADLYKQALAAWTELGDQGTVAYVLRSQGICLRHAGDVPSAADSTRGALKLFRQLRDHYGTGTVLTELGRLALQAGQVNVAAQNFEGVLRDPAQVDPANDMVHNWVEAVEGLAWVAQRRGELERAARLIAAATTVRRARNLPFPSRADYEAHEREVTRLAAALGPAWDAARAAGRGLTPRQTIDEALRRKSGR